MLNRIYHVFKCTFKENLPLSFYHWATILIQRNAGKNVLENLRTIINQENIIARYWFYQCSYKIIQQCYSSNLMLTYFLPNNRSLFIWFWNPTQENNIANTLSNFPWHFFISADPSKNIPGASKIPSLTVDRF